MKSPGYIRESNIQSLSLEAMGFLLMLAYGIEEDAVLSSKVAMEAAKEELVAKGRIKYIEKGGVK